jgi:hypothetical protein
MQIKLLPVEWGLSASSYPEIWWFTWANDAVIIRAHKCPYAHQQFTYSVAESDPDMHSAFNPGIIESLEGLQRYMDWMYNVHLTSLQKHLNDALIFAPALVEESDLTNPGAARHVRLTTAGEELIMSGGYNINQFVHQLPLQDVTSPHLSAVTSLFQLGQRMTAANDPQMAMPTEGKHTLGEIQTITASSSQRLAITARLIDEMAIQPLAKRAISNRQQFTTMEQYFRIVGEDADMAAVQHIVANRKSVIGNFDYMPVDGALPADPQRAAQTWFQIAENVARYVPLMQQMGITPPDGMVPDVNAILREGFKNMGVRNLDKFYTQLPPPPQVVPDEQVAQGAADGNLAPVGPDGMPM